MSLDRLLRLDDRTAGAERIEYCFARRAVTEGASSEALFDALLFNLQVIGEAVRRLRAEAPVQPPEAADPRPARLRDRNA